MLFVDASISARDPFEFYRIQANKDNSYTTHAMSPQSLLAVYEKVNKQAAPASFMLSVRGYEFALGAVLSDKGLANLDQAVIFIKQYLTSSNIENGA